MQKTLDVLNEFVHRGGKVIWTSIYPILSEDNVNVLNEWMELFGIVSLKPAFKGLPLKDAHINFEGMLKGIKSMEVITDMLPDLVYPALPLAGSEVVARSGDNILGIARKYAGGGLALYTGFRPRDDQSCSMGEDVDTLFRILLTTEAYEKDCPEALSRPTESPYIINKFPNGAVSLTNHYRTFAEAWSGSFFRNDKEDEEFLRGCVLPSIDIELKDYMILGHEITYSGIDVLTYNIDKNGDLLGFAGNETRGITIDGKEYRFAEEPVNLVFTIMPEKHMVDSIKALYMVRINKPVKVRLPLPITEIQNLKVEVCENNIFKTDRSIPYKQDKYCLELNVTTAEIDKWIAIIS